MLSLNARTAVRRLYLIMGCCLMCGSAPGTTFYVRPGAIGNDSGTDWINAYPGVPPELQRGATYYLADGAYEDARFIDDPAGASVIVLKKAIVSDHGTQIGWQASYGDGQAVFDSMTFDAPYYHIDGQTGGGPGSWKSGFGIKIQGNFPHVKLCFLEENAHQITVEHVEMRHRGLYTGTADDGVYSLAVGPNFIMRNCYLHVFGRAPILSRYENNWLIEKCYIALNSSTAQQHSEAWSDIGSTSMTVRNNIFADIEGTAYIAFLGTAEDVVAGWNIHGNVFMKNEDNPTTRAGFGDGMIAVTKGTGHNMKIHNNAFINVQDAWFGRTWMNEGRQNEVFNNIWFMMGQQPDDDPIPIFCDGERSNNALLQLNGGEITADPGNITGDDDPFVDWVHLDFRLKPGSPLINAGRAPADPSDNLDANGNQRGFDGSWDIGPVEYVPDPIWVAFDYAGEVELGTEPEPYNTLAEGADAVSIGGTICLKPGQSGETIRITKAMHLTAHEGTVRVGNGGSSEASRLDQPTGENLNGSMTTMRNSAEGQWMLYR